jgi:hypothetical protein
MGDFTDPELVSREYAALERLAMRRVDRTGWLCGGVLVADRG